jgi:hypothetical protein
VLALYHQGQMTSERLVELLGDLGLAISKREVVRILTAGKDTILDEVDRVLRAGLETAAWISVDGPSGNAVGGRRAPGISSGTASAPRSTTANSRGSGPPGPRTG